MMRRWGYKAGMIAGYDHLRLGMVLFWPAAMSGQFICPFFLRCSWSASGASMLETACNPFMAQFGSAETSERRSELRAVIQSAGNDHRRDHRRSLYLLRHRAETTANCRHAQGRNLFCLSAQRAHARGTDLHRASVWLFCRSHCFYRAWNSPSSPASTNMSPAITVPSVRFCIIRICGWRLSPTFATSARRSPRGAPDSLHEAVHRRQRTQAAGYLTATWWPWRWGGSSAHN